MEGFKYLSTYILATVISDLTMDFVKKWINPKSRTKDQMEQAANMLLTFCQMQTFLLNRQIDSLKEKFVKEGGFRENLFRKRLEEKRKS